MPLKQTMPLVTTRPRTRPALVLAIGSAASGKANAAFGISASAPIAAPPCNTFRRSIFMPSRSFRFGSDLDCLIVLEVARDRMVVIVIPNRTIANGSCARLADLACRQLDLPFTHPQNNFMLVDVG